MTQNTLFSNLDDLLIECVYLSTLFVRKLKLRKNFLLNTRPCAKFYFVSCNLLGTCHILIRFVSDFCIFPMEILELESPNSNHFLVFEKTFYLQRELFISSCLRVIYVSESRQKQREINYILTNFYTMFRTLLNRNT